MVDSVAQPHPEAFITLNSLGVGDQCVDVVLGIEEAPREQIGPPGCQRQYKLRSRQRFHSCKFGLTYRPDTYRKQ